MTVRIALPASLVVALAGCDRPESNAPTAPSPPSPNGVEIIGPGTVPPGTPVQYSATVRLSDGSSKSVSGETDLRWQISNGSVMQVSQSGLVTPLLNQGEASITAIVRVGNVSRQASRELVIQPNGTFRLTGVVVEVLAPGVSIIPVVGARVEIDPGSHVTFTDTDGRYQFYGVPSSATLRVTAPFYEPSVIPLQLTSNLHRAVPLVFTGTRHSVAGSYTLTISAPNGCGTLPPEFRTRQYQAVMTQSGTDLDVTLGGPPFRLSGTGRGNKFRGTVTSSGALFSLPWPDYVGFEFYPFYSLNGYAHLVEAVSDGRFLVIHGDFATLGSAAGLSGTSTSARLTLWDSRFPSVLQRLLSSCTGLISFRLDPR